MALTVCHLQVSRRYPGALMDERRRALGVDRSVLGTQVPRWASPSDCTRV